MNPPQRLVNVLQHPGRFPLRVWRGFRTSQGLLLASPVYGSLAMAMAMRLSLEQGATLLLLSAQVISGYEGFGDRGRGPALPFTTRAI